MRKLEIKEAALMRLALHDEIRRSEDSRYDHRLHGVLLVCSGLSCYAVAELLGQSPRTVHPLFCRQDTAVSRCLQRTKSALSLDSMVSEPDKQNACLSKQLT